MLSIEDFTEFEQRAAYFDGDIVAAAQKGVNILERGSQVHFMSEVMSILDFPPAPKLDLYGKLDRAKAPPEEPGGRTRIAPCRGRCLQMGPGKGSGAVWH